MYLRDTIGGKRKSVIPLSGCCETLRCTVLGEGGEEKATSGETWRGGMRKKMMLEKVNNT